MKIPLASCALMFAASVGFAADVPATLQPTNGEKVVLRAHASGWQIYTCSMEPDGKPKWTLKGPDAELKNGKGKVVGHHSAGPTWKYEDGSEVTGKAVAHVDSPDPDSVPWLLLTATGHSGTGTLSSVTSIQRLHTKGGQPPAAAECDASKASPEARSRYTADYYFYAPSK
jgi:hypothetical protein